MGGAESASCGASSARGLPPTYPDTPEALCVCECLCVCLCVCVCVRVCVVCVSCVWLVACRTTTCVPRTWVWFCPSCSGQQPSGSSGASGMRSVLLWRHDCVGPRVHVRLISARWCVLLCLSVNQPSGQQSFVPCIGYPGSSPGVLDRLDDPGVRVQWLGSHGQLC